MIIVCKLGNTNPAIDHPKHLSGWCDGQIVDVLPDGAGVGTNVAKHFACIRVSNKLDWKDRYFSRLISHVDGAGKYPWEAFFDDEANPQIRKVNYFLDLKKLVDDGRITESQRKDIYNKDKSMGIINMGVAADTILRVEGVHDRLDPSKLLIPGSISTGDHEIGAAGAYANLMLFEADLDTLTGNCRALHRDEETAFNASRNIDVNTGAFKLTITAKPGAEHNGQGYGNGARIKYTGVSIGPRFYEDCVDAEWSKLAVDVSGNNTGSSVVRISTLSGIGTIDIFRNLWKGDGNCGSGSWIGSNTADQIVNYYNNIIYGFSADGGWSVGAGIALQAQYANGAVIANIYNNTIAKCFRGLNIYHSNGHGTYTFKNNFLQGSIAADFGRPDLIDTHAKNISEDATSPDAAYRNLDKHANFADYANDNYILDVCDADTACGENLSGIFIDDIIGTIRFAPWCIGASQHISINGNGKKIYPHWMR